METSNNFSNTADIRRFPGFALKGLVRAGKQYRKLVVIVLLSVALFRFAYLFQDEFHRIMDVATYLAWHSIFEFSSILVSFAVFIVSYYTYDQTKNLSSIVIGNVFLAVGMIDTFHTLSYMGMPAFFVENLCANRATTFWIIARLLAAAGFIAVSFIPVNMAVRLNKRVLLILSIIFCAAVFTIVTYYPHLIPRMYLKDEGLTHAKIALEYVVILMLAVTAARQLFIWRKTRSSLVITFAGALILSMFSEFAFTNYYSVYDIYNYLGHLYKTIAYYLIFKATFIHSVQKPYVELTAAQEELKSYADNLDRLVEKRTLQLQEMNEKLLNDLEYARDIQRAMLPQKLPDGNGVSFGVRYFPAERVSGDFYNAFRIDETHIAFYIGDVSGHGVPSAMLTVFLNQSIRTVRRTCGSNDEIKNPSAVLKSIYNSFNSTNFKEEVYIVLIYGVYNAETGLLTYASAGMNVAPLLARATGETCFIEITGFPICKFKEYYDAEYDNKTIKLEKGDKILFYTDGLIDAKNEEKQTYSDSRLKSAFERYLGFPADEICGGVASDVFDFIGMRRPEDDITFFIMEIEKMT